MMVSVKTLWATFYSRNRRVPRVLACKITIESIENEAEPVYRN